MNKKNDLNMSEKHIVEWLNIYYGIQVTTLIPLFLGADMNASIFKADALDQRSYFVKIKLRLKSDNLLSVAILDLLHHEGIEQIILPLKNSKGQLTQQIDEFTMIVYPFIEGQNGFNQTLTENQWITLGNALKKVHEVKLPSVIQNQIRREVYSPKWREAVLSVYDQMGAMPIRDEWAKKLILFMKVHKEKIHRLVERADVFAQKIRQNSSEFVLCHSDLHGGNVLIGPQGLIYMIDWDAPIMAPKERDLMFIGGGVANVWNNQDEEDWFYKGYGKVEINKPVLAYYRHERIVEDIAEYAQALLMTTGGDDRPEMYKHFTAMFEPRGVVEIAFKTDVDLAT